MKKLIASLLTVATVASMSSLSAFAAKETDFTTTGVIYSGDKAYGSNEIQPDNDIFINLDDLTAVDGTTHLPKGDMLLNDDMFKVKTDKGDDDTKIIKKISVVEDNVDGEDGRENVIKIELKDDMTDDEFKITPSVTFTAKYNMDKDGNKVEKDDEIIFEDGYKLTVELGKFYVTNKEMKGDHDWSAGDNGYVAKPTKNDDNEVTWEDENNTLVSLTFESDDDAAKYYPKLSTKWEDADYAENFAETDAFIRSFIGNPTISSTSRPVVEFFNPFVDDDEELTVAVEDVVIYEVKDGALVDVTEKFTAGENEDGDSVFTIKTRTLGTYIFSNGPAVAPAEEIEEPIEEPADEKANPGTGRF